VSESDYANSSGQNCLNATEKSNHQTGSVIGMLQPRILDLNVTKPTTDTGSTISNAVRPTSSAVASTSIFVNPAGIKINSNPLSCG